MSDPLLTQIVLAAGRSRRMGRAKALLPFGESTALELVVRAGRAVAGSTRLVLAADDFSTAEAWPRDLAGLLVVRADPEADPIDSLRAAIGAAPLDARGASFVHPVDVPLVDANDYRLLAEALRADIDGAVDCFKPEHGCFKPDHGGRRGHPVLLRNRFAVKLCEEPRPASLREALRACETRSVAGASPAVLEDMDTPEDYERLLGLFDRRREGTA